MTVLIHPGAPPHQAQLEARALDTRRDAELLVQLRWDTFLEADRASHVQGGPHAHAEGHRDHARKRARAQAGQLKSDTRRRR